MRRSSKGWDEQSKYVDRPSHRSSSQAWGQGADRGRRDTRLVFRCGSVPSSRPRSQESEDPGVNSESPPPPSTGHPIFSLLLTLGATLPFPPLSVAAFPHLQMAAHHPGLPRATVLLPRSCPRCRPFLDPPAPSHLFLESFLSVSLDTRDAGMGWLWSSHPRNRSGLVWVVFSVAV